MKCSWKCAITNGLKTKERVELTKEIINSLQLIIYLPESLQKLYWKYINEK